MNLPLTNNPEESFRVSIFNIVYTFKQLWNPIGFWTLTIRDSDNLMLVDGVKIITKDFLLKQYPQIPFDLYSDEENDPGRFDLNEFLLTVIEKDV